MSPRTRPAEDRYAAPSPARAATWRYVGLGLVRSAYRVSVVGAERVPTEGPVLLTANHAGLLDGPLVFGVAPRPVTFLVKTEMFSGPMGWLLDWCGQVPVDRGFADRRALMQSLAVLSRGDAVGVFPEGTRGRGDVAAVHAGAAWLAVQSGAPVVPVACLGTRRSGESVNALPRPGRQLAVVFGEPMTLTAPRGVPRRRATDVVAGQLREALAEHVSRSSAATGLALPADDPIEQETAP